MIKVDNLTNKELLFWNKFFENYPVDEINYLHQYVYDYKDSMSKIVQDYETIKRYEVLIKSDKLEDIKDAEEIIKNVELYENEYFVSYCDKLNKLIDGATMSQHFLLFILANDMTGWDLDVRMQNNSINFQPNEKAHVRHTLPIQVSLITVLVEDGYMNKIYPQLNFLTNRSVEGKIDTYYKTKDIEIKDKVVKEKNKPALFSCLSMPNDLTQYIYTHKEVANTIKNNPNIEVTYNYRNQDEITKFIFYNDLKEKIVDKNNNNKKIKL